MSTLTCVLLWSLLSSAAPAAPAPTAAPAAPAVALPRPKLQDVPGWLGFATVKPETEKPKYYWSPGHPSAQAVLFSEEWKAVPAGTKVTLLSAAGVQAGSYVETSEQHFGCEENHQTMAGFRASAPLPEGPVWILPGEGTPGAAVVPVKEVPADSLGLTQPKGKKLTSKDARAFAAGDLGFLLTKTGRLKGLLTVVLQGKRVASLPLEKGGMEGADTSPLKLSDDEEVGLALPLAAFQLGASGPFVVVLGLRGYEGHNFLFAVRRGDKVTLNQDDAQSLYYCAF